MPPGSSPVSRAASAQDLPELAGCVASAFHEDPLWGRWAFPDRSTRAARLREFMGAFVSAAVRYPWVRMTGRAEAVAVWLPPGEPEMSDQEERAFQRLICRLTGPRAADVQGLLAQFDRQHPHDPPHYYLSIWATHRDHAGRGLGAELMRDCLARIDAERMPAYLESTNPANLERYEALGFRPRDRFGPAGGPVITTMWRDAG
jgi:ribosomal protein S18 acetylase RimI-like enzyme